VHIPDGIETIGHTAFEGCEQLCDVFFGADPRISRIERGAFAECRESRCASPGMCTHLWFQAR
jgi:hypothetical protein